MFTTTHENQIFSGNAKVDSVYHNAEWLITAFASTLVFIIFVMQVYRIPTGSMAETLRGAHFRIRCAECGYRYDYDFIAERYGMKNTANPAQKLPVGPLSPRCPSCGYTEPKPVRARDGRYFIYKDGETVPAYARTVFKGDQIFVLKSIYQFVDPKRWDVIVFKNPTEPRINYIKRCIALPGETLQIIDGDIFIDGHIQRKPEKVQEELWMIVYDNDHPPAHPDASVFHGHAWKQPFEKVGTSKWNVSENNSTVFTLDSNNPVIHRLRYNDSLGNDFKATYAYDDPGSFQFMPVCSDLMVHYYVSMQDGSAAGAQIHKRQTDYQGWVRSDGTMEIARLTPGGQSISLIRDTCNPSDLQAISRFRFAVVDQRLVLSYGASRLEYDLGTEIDALGEDTDPPSVEILGIGTLELSHVKVYRDIHYLSDDAGHSNFHILRATRSKPMVLGEDEFFACGDNSPYSLDSRLWDKEGLKNNGGSYPAGIVPKDYLVGKGMFVHWPGGYRIGPEPIRWIPFPDGMKPIYGGE